MLKSFFYKNKFSLLVAALFLVYGFDKGNTAVDIQVHDTYYVIAIQHITMLIAAFIFLINLIYFIFERKEYWISKRLKITHTITGVLTLLLGVYLFDYMFNFEGIPYEYYSPTGGAEPVSLVNWSNLLITIFAMLLLLTLILVGCNFIRAIIKGKRSEKIKSDDSILDS